MVKEPSSLFDISVGCTFRKPKPRNVLRLKLGTCKVAFPHEGSIQLGEGDGLVAKAKGTLYSASASWAHTVTLIKRCQFLRTIEDFHRKAQILIICTSFFNNLISFAASLYLRSRRVNERPVFRNRSVSKSQFSFSKLYKLRYKLY